MENSGAPWLTTSISLRVGAKSAQTGATPTGMVLEVPLLTLKVSSAFDCALMTVTLFEPLLRTKARRVSAFMTPYTGLMPTGKLLVMVLLVVSMVTAVPLDVELTPLTRAKMREAPEMPTT